MNSNTDVYRKLQKHIDNNMPVGFPESKTGLDIRLLKHLFTPEEAGIALELSALPEPLERIHKRIKKKGISIEQLENILDKLVEKGAILDRKHYIKKGNGKYYSKAMLMIGMFELQYGRLSKAFAKDFMAYVDQGFYKEWTHKKTRQIRYIPVNKSVANHDFINTYDNAKDIVRNVSGQIALLNCICREGKDLIDDPCKCSDIRETCLLFEESANMALDHGNSRAITKGEALEVLAKAENAGLILHTGNNLKPHIICCCCGCCCESLRILKMSIRPAEYCHSNYESKVNADMCAGCEECVQVCHMEAITMAGDVAAVDLGRCIGCGVCVAKCSSNAIELRKKQQTYVPPKDHESMYKKMFFERIGISGMLKTMPKMILGQKI